MSNNGGVHDEFERLAMTTAQEIILAIIKRAVPENAIVDSDTAFVEDEIGVRHIVLHLFNSPDEKIEIDIRQHVQRPVFMPLGDHPSNTQITITPDDFK